MASEFGLAVLGGILARAIDYSDSLLADKYTRHVSIQVMKHAAELDLIAYEDPVFYDRLERARVQATDRLGMIQQIGRLIQLVITTITLSVTIIVYSPWLMLLLIAGVLPAFLGESHFAFLGYAKNFRQTPVRRQLDYLRQVGRQQGSRQGTQTIWTQQVSDPALHQTLRRDLRRERRAVAAKIDCRRFPLRDRLHGLLLGLCVRNLADGHRARTASDCGTCCRAQFLQASSNIQQIFSTVSGIADQALFLTDLLAFFDMQPTIQSKPDALPAPRPIVRGFEFRNVSFRYPGSSRLVLNGLNFHLHPGERVALIGENGEGKTTIVKLITRLYDPTEGQVLLDGVDLREYRLEDLYREIGVIFQDFMRYEMTARENIAVGRIEEIDDLTLLEDGRPEKPGGRGHREDSAVTIRCWADASKPASIFPAESGRKLRWRALICAMRNFWFWTSPPPRSMRAASSRFSSALPNSRRERWRSLFRTASQPCAWPTAS